MSAPSPESAKDCSWSAYWLHGIPFDSGKLAIVIFRFRILLLRQDVAANILFPRDILVTSFDTHRKRPFLGYLAFDSWSNIVITTSRGK